MRSITVWLTCLACIALPAIAADLVVYDDQLQNGFQDYSWATHDLANSSPVAQGSASISFEPDGWSGIYLFTPTALTVATYPQLSFQIHGGSGGQLIRLVLQLDQTEMASISLAATPVGSWEQRTIDLPPEAGFFDGIIFQDESGADQATLYLDQIELVESDTPPPGGDSVAITVSPDLDRRAINPMIYGVNFGDPDQLAELRFPARRWGGNSTTRYNWVNDISNKASDWFFMNVPNSVANPEQLPNGSAVDVFIDEALAAGSQAILTVPTIGWAPLDERIKMWSFSEAKYGPQELTECTYFGASPPAWCQPDAGDGRCDPAVNTGGDCSSDGLIVGNDEGDTSQVITQTWVTDWMAHVALRVGNAANGGPQYWALDNEPMLWDSTHRDINPTPLDYDGLWNLTVQYGTAIKAQDPNALVLGPVVWGWCAFFSSAADAAFPNGSCIDGPDRQAHGDVPLVEWYLDQICAHEASTGLRPVDLLDVHFYPQGTVSGLDGDSSSEDPTTAARRLRSVRELWDPSYVSESWVAEPVELIPRLRRWIDASCPGVGLALTEYKWGPDDGITGALAQAEVLALFGREGVDMATRWVAPDPASLAEQAFRLYLSYDGAGARIEGDSVRAESADPDAVAAYAVRRSDDLLYLVLINKDTLARDVIVDTGRLEGDATLYRFDAGSNLALVSTFTPATDGFTLTLPARSASLVVTAVDASLLFEDDFEQGNVGAWSGSAGQRDSAR